MWKQSDAKNESDKKSVFCQINFLDLFEILARYYADNVLCAWEICSIEYF